MALERETKDMNAKHGYPLVHYLDSGRPNIEMLNINLSFSLSFSASLRKTKQHFVLKDDKSGCSGDASRDSSSEQ